MENAVARSRIVGLSDVVQSREFTTDSCLLVVGVDAGENEVIVGDSRLPGIDGATPGYLVERVNRKRCSTVRSWEEVGVDAQGHARRQVGRPKILVDAMRPDDLLGRRHSRGGVRLGPVHDGARQHGLAELAPANREDTATSADLFLLWRQRDRIVRLALRDVSQLPRERIERELVPIAGVGDSLRALDDVQTEIEAVAPEDVAHVLAADDDHLQAGFLCDTFEARRAHLAR